MSEMKWQILLCLDYWHGRSRWAKWRWSQSTPGSLRFWVKEHLSMLFKTPSNSSP